MTRLFEPSARQLGQAAVQTLRGRELLEDGARRMALAERLLAAFEKAAKQSGAPVTLEGGLKIHWRRETPVSPAGFVYYDYEGRMTAESALRWVFEELERKDAQRAATRAGEA